MRRLLAVLILLAGLLPAAAQDLPQWESTTVNDFAGLLTPEDADALDAALSDLRDETGVEGTVVTLTDRARHGGADGLEAFATRLFNHWGVGDAQRNNGFMLLVLTNDREARIELGRGYQNDADIIAQDITRGTLLPAFRDGRMSQGIRNGTQDIITHIVLPTTRGEAVRRPDEPLAPKIIGFGIWAAIMALIGRHVWRRNRCPQCGKRDFTTSRSPHREELPEGGYRVSSDDVTRTCRHCGWSDTRQRTNRNSIWYGADGTRIRSERNSRSGPGGGGSSGFSGGSSRGGGASGRW
ncbi:TPM domain-containing protein [Paracoccus lutimaris]|uniref:TPM domain-containing protein n=1 Tax=Paracoccus lutimaris TaxID=1490030 RepID=A0A368YK62_9RHOB|nr:TPM domain-containing protein [Paracoccus lutimaris]RCW79706.1 uncharacterized protein DFP89_12337 [Paracoccus lutimaris]